MPTGYTASVADGTVTELKDFILPLARGMGALISMRDEPWDAPIPDKFKPSDYHANRVNELVAERQRLIGLEPENISAEILRECNEYDERKAKAEREQEEKKQRYNTMIEKVEAWTGSPEGLKGFALEQLRQSREFDCREPFRFWGTEPETNPDLWHEDKLEKNAKEIEYHAAENGKEIERTKSRNEWLKQLKESLK